MVLLLLSPGVSQYGQCGFKFSTFPKNYEESFQIMLFWDCGMVKASQTGNFFLKNTH